jgi:hypothetical protein
MQTPIMNLFWGSPFASASVPSVLMIGYAFLYLVVALFIAVRIFQARDL